MKKTSAVLSALFLLTVTVAAAAPALKLVGKYNMPTSVKGPKFDHLAVDIAGKRLFATGESDHEVLVFDLNTGKYLHSITGIEIPHSVHVSDNGDRIFVVDGGTGLVRVYDGKTYKQLKSIQLKEDADSVVYDPKTHDLYVVNGGGDVHEKFSMISVIDTQSESKVGDIKLDGDTLEQMAIGDDSTRLYESNRALNRIDVVNLQTRSLVTSWPITMGKTDVSIALDEADHRIFSGCRSGVIVVFDSQTGKELKSLPINAGVDDLIFDPAGKRLYAATKEGYIDVYQVNGPDNFESLGRVQAAPGSKNEVLAPSLKRLYTTIPPQQGKPAMIYAFEVE